MLRREAILPGTLEVLIELMEARACEGFVLGGGTALGLQLGHRRSDDLDLFSEVSFDPAALLAGLETSVPKRATAVSADTLLLHVGDLKVDLLGYKYPRLRPVQVVEQVRMFSLPDLAAMKLSALASRGARKDFFDVACLIERFGLPALLKWYEEKFAGHDVFPVIKSLTYFEDAEDEPDPVLLTSMTWSQSKQLICEAVGALAAG